MRIEVATAAQLKVTEEVEKHAILPVERTSGWTRGYTTGGFVDSVPLAAVTSLWSANEAYTHNQPAL